MYNYRDKEVPMKYFRYAIDRGLLQVKSHIYRISTYHYNWHNHIELLWVLKGALEVCVEGQTYTLQRNDMILYSSQCGHATLALEEDTIALVFHVEPQWFLQYDQDFMKYRFVSVSTQDVNIAERYRELRQSLAYIMNHHTAEIATSALETMKVDGIIYTVLSNVYEIILANRYENQLSTKILHQEENFERMVHFIDEHFRDRLELATIADVGGYTESYTSQLFKRQLGITFLEYVSRMRLREAAIRLVNTDDMVIHIASYCGFPDVKAFNSAFKKHFKLTPSAYRERAKRIERHTVLEDWKEYISADDTEIKGILTMYGSYLTRENVKYEENEYTKQSLVSKVQRIKEELQQILQTLE